MTYIVGLDIEGFKIDIDYRLLGPKPNQGLVSDVLANLEQAGLDPTDAPRVRRLAERLLSTPAPAVRTQTTTRKPHTHTLPTADPSAHPTVQQLHGGRRWQRCVRRRPHRQERLRGDNPHACTASW